MPQNKPSAAKRSAHSTKALANKLRTSINKVWRSAPKAPMFLKKLAVKLTPAEKENLAKMSKEQAKSYMKLKNQHAKMRSVRLISANTFAVAAAAASHSVRQTIERDAARLRIPGQAEAKTAPFVAGVTPAAQSLLTHWLVAYCQEAGRAAVDVRKNLGNAKRLNGDLVRFGFEHANEKLFPPLAPRAIFDSAVKHKPVVAATAEEKALVKELPTKERAAALRKFRAAKRATEAAAPLA